MKAPFTKDVQGRQNFKTYEEEMRLFKALKKNKIFQLSGWGRNRLDSFPTTSYKNRCLITNRGKAISSQFKLSRQEFKRWAGSQKLPGVHPKY